MLPVALKAGTISKPVAQPGPYSITRVVAIGRGRPNLLVQSAVSSLLVWCHVTTIY